ncbi:unnamed protein product [Coffea canephora]|uniref:Uncharacterized protein n=1 Tax=Coffea canephora TaxID=49390 RepID=A0A068UHM1_COFCA|nr:unnamed protein product [Coffea canephora]
MVQRLRKECPNAECGVGTIAASVASPMFTRRLAVIEGTLD